MNPSSNFKENTSFSYSYLGMMFYFAKPAAASNSMAPAIKV